jgi:hypothetical protein
MGETNFVAFMEYFYCVYFSSHVRYFHVKDWTLEQIMNFAIRENRDKERR